MRRPNPPGSRWKRRGLVEQNGRNEARVAIKARAARSRIRTQAPPPRQKSAGAVDDDPRTQPTSRRTPTERHSLAPDQSRQVDTRPQLSHLEALHHGRAYHRGPPIPPQSTTPKRHPTMPILGTHPPHPRLLLTHAFY